MITEEQLDEWVALLNKVVEEHPVPWVIKEVLIEEHPGMAQENICSSPHLSGLPFFVCTTMATGKTGTPPSDIGRFIAESPGIEMALIAEVRRLQESINTLMSRISEERDECTKVEARLEMELDEAKRAHIIANLHIPGHTRDTAHLACTNYYGIAEADRLFPEVKQEMPKVSESDSLPFTCDLCGVKTKRHLDLYENSLPPRGQVVGSKPLCDYCISRIGVVLGQTGNQFLTAGIFSFLKMEYDKERNSISDAMTAVATEAVKDEADRLFPKEK